MNRILTICTGNTCRSPLAAAALGRRLGPDYRVESAGVAVAAPSAATPEAIEAAAALGLDLSLHLARQLDAELASAFDLFLVMERKHLAWISARIASARGRTYLLGRWRQMEIADPFGAGIDQYRLVSRLISTCADDWATRL